MASHFALLLCISLAIVAVFGENCGGRSCDYIAQIETLNCPYGKVYNPCRCCTECRKGEGEECGGLSNVFGTCAEGLVCRGGYGIERPGHCKAQRPYGRK
ncbi:insulin-like growth factor-binding protein 7 [Macrobrachium nipponense]|uniref:insulin-like growth factor-binding protein 7 n=1 Tax=Macrobrachium nipponense TaxID=159736 RepID=UPI0030C86F17